MGPHAREQQDWSHCTVPSGQSVPATLQLPLALPPGAWHVPARLVPVFTQLPLQHWPFVKQMSPNCVQYDTSDEQTPFAHSFEQQSVPTLQPLPAVRQVVLMEAHLPPTHRSLQHCAFDEQFPATGRSGTQALEEHFWLTQKPEQQSPAWMQLVPSASHAPPSGALHTLGVGTPHTPPFAHLPLSPQKMRPPQPSGTWPQERPAHAAAWVAGWHWTPPPQTLGTPPPPHTFGAVHVPQFCVSPPQPSAT